MRYIDTEIGWWCCTICLRYGDSVVVAARVDRRRILLRGVANPVVFDELANMFRALVDVQMLEV